MTPLRQRMLEGMSIRHLAENTQQSYLHQISSYAKHFRRSPEVLGPEGVRTYQVYLTAARKCAATNVGIARSALRFLYTVTLKQNWAPDEIATSKMPFKRPVVLSPEEVMQFRDCVDSVKNRSVLTTAYAAGQWVSNRHNAKCRHPVAKMIISLRHWAEYDAARRARGSR